MEIVKLATPLVICENASGKTCRINLRAVRLLKEAGRVARLRRRDKDGAITRVMLLAEPDEIARPSMASETMIELHQTWWHRRCLGLLGKASAHG